MRKTILVAVLVALASPAFALANDGTPQSATAATTTPASQVSAIANDGSPPSSSTNRR